MNRVGVGLLCGVSVCFCVCRIVCDSCVYVLVCVVVVLYIIFVVWGLVFSVLYGDLGEVFVW